MKKILLLPFLLCFMVSYSQTKQPVQKQSAQTKVVKKDSSLIRIDSMLNLTTAWLEHIELNMSLKNRYKLYQTENIYTFLQLDTKTGKIEQVQWSLDSYNEVSVVINGDNLTLEDYGSGTFELYPTKNMYQFLLLDKTNGRRWHVQWGMKSGERWIRRIY